MGTRLRAPGHRLQSVAQNQIGSNSGCSTVGRRRSKTIIYYIYHILEIKAPKLAPFKGILWISLQNVRYGVY